MKPPAERAVYLSELLDSLQQTLGDTDAKTLRVMTSLYEVYGMLGRGDDAERLHSQVMEMREPHSSSDDLDLYELYLDRVYILYNKGDLQKAHDYATTLVDKATKTFGECHPVSLNAHTRLAAIDAALGKQDLANDNMRLALESYENTIRDAKHQDIDVPMNLVNLKVSLSLGLCEAQDYMKAEELAEQASRYLEHAKPEDFLTMFTIIIDNLAKGLDYYARHYAAERVHTNVVEICKKRHGKKKFYCTRTALQHLLYTINEGGCGIRNPKRSRS